MISYIIQIGYSKEFKFDDYDNAINFALSALESQKESDEIIMKFKEE